MYKPMSSNPPTPPASSWLLSPRTKEKASQQKGMDDASKQETSKESAPKRGLFRRLSDRSIRKSGRIQTKGVPPQQDKDEFELLQVPTEEDPVIALFEARNKQRVRFCAEVNAGVSKNENAIAKEPNATKEPDDDGGNVSPFNIKTFMGRIIFNKTTANPKQDAEEDEEDFGKSPIVWESNQIEEESPEVVYTTSSPQKTSFKVSFSENAEVRSTVVKLLDKARRAQFSHYRYRYAVKCYIKANELLSEAKYPDDHPLLTKVLRLLNNAHHALSCFDNSANITQMGVKHEEQNDLIKALKMYTIAYRIRRDQLSPTHPSLVVLLNILGSIQVKRGELKEAMQIYELALRDAPATVSFEDDDDQDVAPIPSSNLLARAVTFREMGIIHEKWGDPQKALRMCHRSLGSISQWQEETGAKYRSKPVKPIQKYVPVAPSSKSDDASVYSIDHIQLSKSYPTQVEDLASETGAENGEMEVFIRDPQMLGLTGDTSVTEFYNSFFPGVKESTNKKKKKKKMLTPTGRDAYADVDVSLTFHQIAQMHKKQRQFGRSLDAYRASLRGMIHALGDIHPNVAAILGNIGNLQKDMGNLDAAYETYQDVLTIESKRLGVSHPEVAISLHNVATIEAGRGNYQKALAIYQKVLNLQKKLFGDDNLAVANTSASMGDVYERLGHATLATDCYEESLRAKTNVLGRHDLQIARMLHKLGKMAFVQKDYNLANSYTSRAVLVYRLNKITEDHEWLIDAERDAADICAALALGGGRFFEV